MERKIKTVKDIIDALDSGESVGYMDPNNSGRVGRVEVYNERAVIHVFLDDIPWKRGGEITWTHYAAKHSLGTVHVSGYYVISKSEKVTEARDI